MHLIGKRGGDACRGAICQRLCRRPVLSAVGRRLRGGTMRSVQWLAAFAMATCVAATAAQTPATTAYFPVARGAHPHDVAATPQPDGPVYYTEQATGKLGILDPETRRSIEVALGDRSAPHG